MYEENKHAEHGYVDLGLSVNWATANIGAEYPEDAGRYFSFEDIHLKEFAGKDPARELWGGEWHMPTADEIREFKNFCEIKRIELFKTAGFIVKAAYSKNSLFIPASGMWSPTDKLGEAELNFFWDAAYLWSSDRQENDVVSWLAIDDAICSEQDCAPGTYTTAMVNYGREDGRMPIRPILAKKKME